MHAFRLSVLNNQLLLPALVVFRHCQARISDNKPVMLWLETDKQT